MTYRIWFKSGSFKTSVMVSATGVLEAIDGFKTTRDFSILEIEEQVIGEALIFEPTCGCTIVYRKGLVYTVVYNKDIDMWEVWSGTGKIGTYYDSESAAVNDARSMVETPTGEWRTILKREGRSQNDNP